MAEDTGSVFEFANNDADEMDTLAAIGTKFEDIVRDIDGLIPECRQASLAKTHLETAFLFVQHAVTLKGLAD
jgi:hypothetical protein